MPSFQVHKIALIAFTVTTSAAAQSLIPNGGFEQDVSMPCAQGHLPAPWAQAGPVNPGADLYSFDCKALPGIPPTIFNNFSLDPLEGLRFVAGWSFGEPYGVPLKRPLSDGASYQISGFFAGSVSHSGLGPIELYLSDDSQHSPNDILLGSIATNAQTSVWKQDFLDFTAPVGAQTLPYLIFLPVGLDSYLAVDDLKLVGPCGPHAYCQSKTNSAGCDPAATYSGSASIGSGLPFEVSATQVLNNKNGLLLYGYGAAAVPFQGGVLCIQGSPRRTAVQSSGGNMPPNDCSGRFAFDFNAHIRMGTDPGLAHGVTVFCQYWYRDSADPHGSGLTNGLRFLIGN